jgi:hypothetical protein
MDRGTKYVTGGVEGGVESIANHLEDIPDIRFNGRF